MKKIIAIIFDFDDTLAPDSTTSYLNWMNIDIDYFWKSEVNPLLADGWDPIPAYLSKMIDLSDSRPRGTKFTHDSMIKWGKQIKPFPGVTKMFAALREHADEAAAQLNIEVDLEYYMISSGISDIVSNSPIAKHFKDIWACNFEYRDDGSIKFPKNIVGFTDKTRFIYQISKGMVGELYKDRPYAVNEKVTNFRVPISQMVYVGDGLTDIPCFALMNQKQGKSIGVYNPTKREKWGSAYKMAEDNRIKLLHQVDYTKGSGLREGLFMSIDSICNAMATRGK